MKRVAVIGISGAGKSTFACKLSEMINVPVTHLDVFYNDDSLGYKQNHDAWIKMVTTVEDSDAWIIEGNYGATMPHRFERADTIFWFKMSTYVALKGIYLRRFDKVGRLGMPKGWKESVDWTFFKYVASYNRRHHDTEDVLREQHGKEVVIFKNHKQVNEYLKKVEERLREQDLLT